MQLDELNPDDYYYAEYARPTEFAIVKGTIGKRSNLYVNTETNQTSFWKYNESIAKKHIRLATKEEIHWLDCCIDRNTFIPYEDAMLTYIEPIISYQQDSEYNNILIKLLS